MEGGVEERTLLSTQYVVCVCVCVVCVCVWCVCVCVYIYVLISSDENASLEIISYNLYSLSLQLLYLDGHLSAAYSRLYLL